VKLLITEEDKVQLALGTKQLFRVRIEGTLDYGKRGTPYASSELVKVLNVECAGVDPRDAADRIIKELDGYMIDLCARKHFQYRSLLLRFLSHDYIRFWNTAGVTIKPFRYA